MTHYPNREHMNADAAARRRAVAALEKIGEHTAELADRLNNGAVPEPGEAYLLTGQAARAATHLAELAMLRDVREWDAADQAEVERALAEARQPSAAQAILAKYAPPTPTREK
jgi:hypothetical protein